MGMPSMRDRRALTNDEIMRAAPSVFADKPYHEVSYKYRFIPTFEMLSTLQSQGWECVQAGEHNVRNQSKRGFQKHMLRMRNNRLPLIGDSQVDLIVYNSHDRTTGFKFQAGLYRFVCANGLTTGENLFEPIRVKHIGYKSEDAIEASFRLIDNVPRIAASVEEMKSITLNADEKRFFAESALIAKHGQPEKGEVLPVGPSSALVVRRSEDRKDDLWTTFNVVQENLIRGGVRTVNTERTKRVKTRGVSSITESSKLNAALWNLAERMKEIKAA